MRKIIDVSKFKNTYLDISYGNVSETQKLDIYLPEDKIGLFPVIISIHGGAFKFGDKRRVTESMLYGLNKGYAVVGINYRLSGEISFPEPVRDIKRAIRFIKANSDKYQLNPDKIIVWGGSAGGYMSLMSGVFAYEKYFDDDKDPNINIDASIQGVVSWFPPTDFLKMDEHLKESGLLNKYPDHDAEDSPESLFLGCPILESRALAQQANPANYLHINIPPMFIQHGRIDKVVPYQQSLEFVKAAQKLVGEDYICYEIVEGADHVDLKFETKENLNKVYMFINKIFN